MRRKLAIPEMTRAKPEEYAQLPALPLTILLDDVRSMQNVGAVFRTADAFRVEKILLCGITPCPPHPLIHKTALGAELVVPKEYSSDAISTVSAYREKGYQIWVLEQTTESIVPEQASLSDQKVLLVAGNEVHGVKEEIVALADCCVEIPQYGTKHSLNVSVSVGIALYSILSPFLPSLRWTKPDK